MRTALTLFVVLILLAAACTPATIETELPSQQAASPPARTDTPAPTPTLAPTPAPTLVPMERALPTEAMGDTSAGFQFFPGNPVLASGGDAFWARKFIDPGAIVFHEGKFHMFYNGIESWPNPVGVGYATSEDGYHWERQVEQPLFRVTDLHPSGEFENLFVTSALVEEDGTWALYYYTMTGSSFTGPQSIFRATAPDPTGPWKADPEPALEPGPEGAWDDVQVGSPDVLQTDDGYLMYYDGMGEDSMIGMATSADGVHWTKYDDPSTSTGIFAGSDPVLKTGGAAGGRRVLDPNVVRDGDRWVMIFLTTSGQSKFSPGIYRLGYALGEDGVHWSRPAENVLLSSTDIPEWKATFLVSLVHTLDTYYLYFDFALGGNRGTNVYLAVFTGDFAP